jgi:hypothetical protein
LLLKLRLVDLRRRRELLLPELITRSELSKKESPENKELSSFVLRKRLEELSGSKELCLSDSRPKSVLKMNVLPVKSESLLFKKKLS